MREWIAANIERWKVEGEDWFKIEKIPDELLPRETFEAEGGAKRRRSSLLEMIAVEQNVPKSQHRQQQQRSQQHLQRQQQPVMHLGKQMMRGQQTRGQQIMQRDIWKSLAEEIYAMKSSNHKSNFTHVKRIFKENEEQLALLLKLCPSFMIILSHILEDKFGFVVKSVDYKTDMIYWGEKESNRIGSSLATFLRKRKTGTVAIESWRNHYVQLDALFQEIDGFEEFMILIANNTLRDSIYGTVYRVTVGAMLSTVDAATDIYVIATYVQRASEAHCSSSRSTRCYRSYS